MKDKLENKLFCLLQWFCYETYLTLCKVVWNKKSKMKRIHLRLSYSTNVMADAAMLTNLTHFSGFFWGFLGHILSLKVIIL